MLSFPSPLLPATFLRRDNRFRATVRLDGAGETVAHVPNSGRLTELLVPDARCYVGANPRPGKTSHVLRLVAHAGVLVSVDARLTNPLFADAWRRGALGSPFSSSTDMRSEVALGDSRLDFLLTGPAGRLWVEVKSVTLVGNPAAGNADRVARFPDAPTVRGTKHLHALMQAGAARERAAVVFVVQRSDAESFATHHSADPVFAAALREAVSRGVHVHAYRCAVTLEGVALQQRIPVLI